MRFKVPQRYTGVSAAHVAAAFRERSLYDAFTDLPFVGRPELVSFDRVADDVQLELRYRVAVELPGPARAVIDPERLSFVERSTIRPDGSAQFVIIPDHYNELATCSGQVTITDVAEGDGDGTTRESSGDLKLDLGWKGKLFEAQVEEAIVNGFRQSIAAQTKQVRTFIADRYGV